MKTLGQVIQEIREDDGSMRRLGDVDSPIFGQIESLYKTVGDLEIIGRWTFSRQVVAQGNYGPSAVFLSSLELAEVTPKSWKLHKLRNIDQLEVSSEHGQVTEISLNSHRAGQRLPMFVWTDSRHMDDDVEQMQALASALAKAELGSK